MLSIEKCKIELEKAGATFSNEELLKIKRLLENLANLEYELFKQTKTIKNAKCDFIHARIDR